MAEDDEFEYDHFEVERNGDDVWLSLTTDDDVDDVRVLRFSPEDALKVGIALAQAGQEPQQ